MIQSVLHSGPFGIIIVLTILALVGLAIWSVFSGKSHIANAIIPIPAILGLTFYSYTIWWTVLQIQYSGSVGDQYWYFYRTSDAGFISFIGCVSSIIVLFLKLCASLYTKEKKG